MDIASELHNFILKRKSNHKKGEKGEHFYHSRKIGWLKWNKKIRKWA